MSAPNHQSTPFCSRFPDEIERYIFLEGAGMGSSTGATDTGSSVVSTFPCEWLLVAKRVYRWLEPVLYQKVDIRCQRGAEHFATSLRSRPEFAKTTVKVLRLRQTVSPEKGAEILQLCRKLQELTLEIIVELPDIQNPLRKPLNGLPLTSLSMNLSSGFYGPFITLPELDILRRVKRLHLTNSWVMRQGLHLGLHKLDQLTHVSFPVHPPGQDGILNGTLRHILEVFQMLQVVVLWASDKEIGKLYDLLEKPEGGPNDGRVVIFNAEQFPEYEDHFWELAETVVQQRDGCEVRV